MARDPATDGQSGEIAQPMTMAFVVRIWFDRSERERTTWRGTVTTVPTNERQHFDDLDRMSLIILHHLERAGIRTTLGWHLRRWWWRVAGHRKG